MNNYPPGMSRSDLIHVGEIDDGWCENCPCEDVGPDGDEIIHTETCDEDACAECEHGSGAHLNHNGKCLIDQCKCDEYEENGCSCEFCSCECHREPNYDD